MGRGKGKGKQKSQCSAEEVQHARAVNQWRDESSRPKKSPGSISRSKARSEAYHAAMSAPVSADMIPEPKVPPPPPPPPRRGEGIRLVPRDEILSQSPSQPGTSSKASAYQPRRQMIRQEVSLSLRPKLLQRKGTKENKGEAIRKLKGEVSLSLKQNSLKPQPVAKGCYLKMPWSWPPALVQRRKQPPTGQLLPWQNLNPEPAPTTKAIWLASKLYASTEGSHVWECPETYSGPYLLSWVRSGEVDPMEDLQGSCSTILHVEVTSSLSNQMD